jgi:hypothetical protein
MQKIKNLTDLNMQVDPFPIGAALNLATLGLEQAEQRCSRRCQVLLERLTLPAGLLNLSLDNIFDQFHRKTFLRIRQIVILDPQKICEPQLSSFQLKFKTMTIHNLCFLLQMCEIYLLEDWKHANFDMIKQIIFYEGLLIDCGFKVFIN